MPQQLGNLGVRHAQGEGVAGEAVPQATAWAMPARSLVRRIVNPMAFCAQASPLAEHKTGHKGFGRVIYLTAEAVAPWCAGESVAGVGRCPASAPAPPSRRQLPAWSGGRGS